MPKLTNPKRERFCQALAQGFGIMDAFTSAGYEAKFAKSNAYKLFKHPQIVGRLAELARMREQIDKEVCKETVHRTAISKVRIIEELAKMAFADIRQVMEWRAVSIEAVDENGAKCIVHKTNVEMKDSDVLDEFVAGAIVEVKLDQRGALTVKLGDKRQALMDIAKLQGYVIDRKELSGAGDWERFTDEELEAIVEGRLDPASATGSRPAPKEIAPITGREGESEEVH